MNRRGFMSAILAAGVSPFVVRAAALMPVRAIGSGLLVAPVLEDCIELGVASGWYDLGDDLLWKLNPV